MGYKRNMIHRMAEEMQRIAYSNDDEKLDPEDIQLIFDAIFYMDSSSGGSDLAAAAIDIYYCETGGMYESFEELPQALDNMVDAIAKHHGFEDRQEYLANELGIEQLKDEGGFYTGIYIKR